MCHITMYIRYLRGLRNLHSATNLTRFSNGRLSMSGLAGSAHPSRSTGPPQAGVMQAAEAGRQCDTLKVT